ncbi:MAG: P-loop NTPase [Candidatus Micrarchaeia archaeon]
MKSYKPEDAIKEKTDIHPSLFNVVREKNEVNDKLTGVRHRIGIYSAKGGVGKTTISINLAFALKNLGYKVGLLDADIDCPNVNLFLGINYRIKEYPLKPYEYNGVKILSTAMLVDDSTKPIIWRGPLIAKMIGDFLKNSDWGDLDYLIIDLPPGTSDAPLSIMQLLNLTGFAMVTTPQYVASINAIRSGIMAKKFNIALLGVIENMSDGYKKGAERVATALECEVLGLIKNNKKIAELSDQGKIPILEDKEIENEFNEIAKKLTK